MKLKQFFLENPAVAVSYSGGTDSSYLLYMAKKYCQKVKAYYVKTAFQPTFELNDAYRFTDFVNVDFQVIELDILSDAMIVSNPADRCYHCKTTIFTTLIKQAKSDGFDLVIDGTNASDDEADRPGMKALIELGVRSPLRECGIAKDDVRSLSQEIGLFTYNKPTYACLATRVPTGQHYTAQLLLTIEQAENALFELGFTDFRVRVLGDVAKLQFPLAQLKTVFNLRTNILKALKPHFSAVLLDLESR